MSYHAAYEEACSHLFFDPDEHPENTLKASQEFIQRFQLRNDLLYPEPPKVSLEAAIERGKIAATTHENASPKPSLKQFDKICEQRKPHDKVSKFLGMYSCNRLYTNWCMTVPEEKTRTHINWCDFVKAITAYHKPTENITLEHFHFRSNMRKDGETFIAFCNRVLVEARHYNF